MTSIQKVNELFQKWSGRAPLRTEPIFGTGSYRQYFRIFGDLGIVVGAYNEDLRENQAFLSFSKHFRSEGLPVPEILAEDNKGHCYLLSDLGDETLFSRLSGIRREQPDFSGELVELYKKVIGWLPRFQVSAGKGIDFGKCYPRAAFDTQSMLWDLNYFKYYFLKLARVPFDEQKLEDDFKTLTAFLLSADSGYFIYRDFQSRNVMILDDEPWFIDYQGGRKGALQYDIASLLYDAKADIPENIREGLLDHYLDVLGKYHSIDHEEFRTYFYGFVLIRILQALGAYGFRGYYEKRPHFLQSIPFAMANLEYLLQSGRIGLKIPMLGEVLERMTQDPQFREKARPASDLEVSVTSFSYKNGMPGDDSGNGGGFVFDCRALPNPGRYPEYKLVTGKDQPVIGFLKREPEVDRFLEHVFSLVDQSVSTYVERGFTHLAVNFGCTGGQHRSVFCAEELTKHLNERFSVKTHLRHREIE
ncbi:MAG: RNase adapter RapZ [bacterium]